MKKKLAIIMNDMHIGGITKASIPLMEELCKYVDVTLILRNGNGEFMHLIPKNINVKIIRGSKFLQNVKSSFKHLNIITIIFLSIKYFIVAKILNCWVQANAIASQLRGYVIDLEYDCAIAYHGMCINVLTRTLWEIKAKKK